MKKYQSNRGIEKLIMETSERITYLTHSELSDVVKELSEYANARLKALRKARLTEAPAYVAVRESGRKKFTEKNKNLNQLRNEFIGLRHFLKSKTSRIRQARAYYNKLYKKVGGEISNDDIQTLWSVYNRLKQYNPNFFNQHDSETIIKLISTQLNRKRSLEEVMERAIDLMDEIEKDELKRGYTIKAEDVITFTYEEVDR